MMNNNDIKTLRASIDDIDAKIVALFEQRLEFAREVGDYKRAHNLAILDASREQAVVDQATARVPEIMAAETALLMRSLMALAREYQRALLFKNDEAFLPEPSEPKRENVRCAFQGVQGAWSEQATHKLFPGATLTAVEFFEDVFSEVKRGAVDYGIVPIENSQSGAIGETYDLLRKYGCYVVGRTWIDIRHCLIAKSGTKLTEVREVFSHPEGFRQCHRFLMDKSWDLIAKSNTAVAVNAAKGSEGNKTAAIGAKLAAEINGLEVLVPDIMDSANNRTSFVVIANQPEYSQKSDLISVTFSLAHRSGSLCEALMPFMASCINLTRIESRPVSADNYRFFAELSGNIMDPKVQETLRHVAGATEYLEVLGCYKTV